MRKSKLFIYTLISILIITQLSVFAAIDITTDFRHQPEGTTNLAFNKTVTFSSNYDNASGSWKSIGLVDGKVGMGNPNGWTTDPNAADATQDKEAWVQVDLGDVYGVSRIVLWPRQDKNPVEGYPVDFTLQISVDGENWTTVATKTNQVEVDAEAKVFDITKSNAKFVRMHCTKRNKSGTQWVVQLAEMAVYGAAASSENPPETSPETSDNSLPYIFVVFVLMAAATYMNIMRKQKV